jgi:uncharacterized membrane protein (Fun14 family)
MRMVIDNILSNIPTPVMTFGASTFAGFFCGFALKKIIKILVLITGLTLGLFFLGIEYMSHKGYLGGQVNWDRIGNDTAVTFHGLYNQFSSQHIFGVLGIPATSGFAAGLVIRLAKS